MILGRGQGFCCIARKTFLAAALCSQAGRPPAPLHSKTVAALILLYPPLEFLSAALSCHFTRLGCAPSSQIAQLFRPRERRRTLGVKAALSPFNGSARAGGSQEPLERRSRAALRTRASTSARFNGGKGIYHGRAGPGGGSRPPGGRATGHCAGTHIFSAQAAPSGASGRARPAGRGRAGGAAQMKLGSARASPQQPSNLAG